MAEQFYTILTKVGKAKIANTSALGSKLNLAKFQVGDSNGSYYNPTEEQTELKHKVWEGPISSITIDENNPNWIVLQTMLPGDIGGFMIREAGVFDDEGNLIAVGKYPETYKPVTSEGSSKDLVIKMILEVSNASSVTLKIDPTTILATKKDIEILENKIKNIKVPVTSVNKKIGDIELKAEDIKCNDGKTVESSLDDKQSKKDNNLNTKDKTVIGSINELNSNKVNNADFENYKKDYVVNNAFGRTSGTSTNYTLTLNPAPTSYKEGMQVTIIPHTDSTGSPYLNINGLGNSALLNQDGTPVELKKDKPYSFVRVGNNFFIRSSSGGDNKMPEWMHNSWTNATNLAYGSSWATASSIGDNIYLFGGYYGYKDTSLVRCYNSKTNVWTEISNMSMPRRNLASSVVGSNIYLTSDTDYFHECYNALTNTWSSRAKPLYVSESSDSKGMYIYTKNDSKIQCYDTVTDKWSEIADIPTQRHCNLSVVGDSIYLIGGYYGSFFDKNESYNLKYNYWSTLSSMPTTRGGVSLSKINNIIYCIGGSNKDKYDVDILEAYDTISNRWETLKNMNQSREDASSSVIGKNIYVIGGAIGKGHNTCLNTVECYIQK